MSFARASSSVLFTMNLNTRSAYSFTLSLYSFVVTGLVVHPWDGLPFAKVTAKMKIILTYRMILRIEIIVGSVINNVLLSYEFKSDQQ